MNYYIGDTHFGHAQCIKHDNRPFDSIEEMDKYIINAWNSRVRHSDNVYIIGDFSFKSRRKPEDYLRKLKGKKYLILGNHDSDIMKSAVAKSYFEDIDNIMRVYDNDNGVVLQLCHYPLAEWKGYYKNYYHIYGHLHANVNDALNYMLRQKRALNAGCMLNNYMPVTLSELILNNNLFRDSVFSNTYMDTQH